MLGPASLTVRHGIVRGVVVGSLRALAVAILALAFRGLVAALGDVAAGLRLPAQGSLQVIAGGAHDTSSSRTAVTFPSWPSSQAKLCSAILILLCSHSIR